MVTGRAPSIDHSAISTAPVSDAGTMPMRYSAGTSSTSRVRSIARLSFALPIFDRCERPRTASVRAERLQPGRLAQGPEEKCGTAGRTAGIALVIGLPFQIGAPRWGGVSRAGEYGKVATAVKQEE